MTSALTTEQFIEKARKIHGNLYDYSLVNYKNSVTKVEIICKEHKEQFLQIPNVHLSGKGCPKCGVRKRTGQLTKSLDKFLEQAKKIHGDLYDYSLVEYKTSVTKVEIVCKVHGSFFQYPYNHYTGAGCVVCVNKNKTSTTQEFIERAIKIHGNKYDYSKVVYINNKTKVIIICKKHGEFKQLPQKHLHGNGCLNCAKEILLLNTEQFIGKAKNIHGNQYDYSKCIYKSGRSILEIICKEHGPFKQKAKNHLAGKKCPQCTGSSGEKLILEILFEEIVSDIFPHKEFIANGINKSNKIIVDFYFELNNKKYIVEYNGRQHYEPVTFGSISVEQAKETFFYQQTRDQFLREMCEKENIVLIEIDGRKIKKKKIIKEIILSKLF